MAKNTLNRLYQDVDPMLYHHPTHYCCYSPTSSTVCAQNKQILQVAMATERTVIDIHQQETTTTHSPYIVISPIYAVCCVVGRLEPVKNELLYVAVCCYFSAEHKMCQHIESTIETVDAPYIRHHPTILVQ